MGIVAVGALISALLSLGPLQAAAQERAPEIYTCVDAQGRQRTSDRPIPECVDREQQLRNPSGTVRAVIGPSLTADERAKLEERQRKAAEGQARQVEERRRERALLQRYPNQAAHDRERAEALAQVATVRQAAERRLNELSVQRERLMAEMEFYRKDPAKAPLGLRRQLEENVHSQMAQSRFIAEQESESARIQARFDAELKMLRRLWVLQGASAEAHAK